ncbi:hypothetical protein HYH02_012118 [Chlamydomonas schloesseri]|uniref:Uncharacterized protein n=1 Tax=Chlamydomonas schloesseri TaxID=2026947 RepID=A0A835W0N8_9CHLO|nr:hypothetical protein HYH02_012118 [Chlamydomonas schloesseri]|eukprot:KAG2434920.1 hypothetical protein HYH02_012118 [Chlamydomonas schloesseri]
MAGSWGIGGVDGAGASGADGAAGADICEVFISLTGHCSGGHSSGIYSSGASGTGSSNGSSSGIGTGIGGIEAGALTLSELVQVSRQLLRLRPALLATASRRGQGDRDTAAALTELLGAVAEAGARHLHLAAPPQPVEHHVGSGSLDMVGGAEGQFGPAAATRFRGRDQGGGSGGGGSAFRAGALLLHNLAKLGDVSRGGAGTGCVGAGGAGGGGRSSGAVLLAEALAAHAMSSAVHPQPPQTQSAQALSKLQPLPAVRGLEPRELQDLVWALGKVVGSAAAAAVHAAPATPAPPTPYTATAASSSETQSGANGSSARAPGAGMSYNLGVAAAAAAAAAATATGTGAGVGAVRALAAALAARLEEPGLLGGMAPVGLSMVVYGMGKMGLQYSDAAVRAAVCEAVAGAARGGGCGPQALANMAWGLSRSLPPPHLLPRHASPSGPGAVGATAAGAVSVSSAPSTSPNRAVASSGGALHRRPLFSQSPPQHAAPSAARGVPVFPAEAAGRASSGAAADAAQAAAVEALVAASEAQLRAFKPRELANLLGGLTALGAFGDVGHSRNPSASASAAAGTAPAAAAAWRLLHASRQYVGARLHDLGPQDVAELLYVYGSVYGSAVEDEPEEGGEEEEEDEIRAGHVGQAAAGGGGAAAGARLWPLLRALEARCLELLGCSSGGDGGDSGRGGRGRQQQPQPQPQQVQMRGYALGTCLWAFARLRYPAQRLVAAVGAGLAAGGEGAAASPSGAQVPAFAADLQSPSPTPAGSNNSSLAGDMPPQQLARFAWALARLSLSAERAAGAAAFASQQSQPAAALLPAAALQRLCDAVAARLPAYDTQSLLMATWALAVLGGGRVAGASAALDAAAGRLAAVLAGAAAGAVPGGAPGLTPGQLAMALWSTARLMESGSGSGGEGAGMQCLRLFNGSRGALLAALPRLGPQGVAMVAWAYATAQLNPGDAALAALWERAAVLAPALPGRGLAMVGGAMAHFRCRHVRLTRALLAAAAARISASDACAAAAGAAAGAGAGGGASLAAHLKQQKHEQQAHGPQQQQQPDDEAVWLPSVVCSLGRLGVTEPAFLQLVCARVPNLLPPPAQEQQPLGWLESPPQPQPQQRAPQRALQRTRKLAGGSRRYLAAAEAVPLLWGLSAMARGPPPPSPAPAAAPAAAHGMALGDVGQLDNLPARPATAAWAGAGSSHAGAVVPPGVVEGLAAVVEAAIRADAGCSSPNASSAGSQPDRSQPQHQQRQPSRQQRQQQLDGGLLSMFLSACVEQRYRPAPAVLQAACALLLPLAPGLASHTLCEVAWAVTMLAPPVRPGGSAGSGGSGAVDLGAHAMLPFGPRTRPSSASASVAELAAPVADGEVEEAEAEHVQAWGEELTAALAVAQQQQQQQQQQRTSAPAAPEEAGQRDELWAAVARLLRRSARAGRQSPAGEAPALAAAAAAAAAAAGVQAEVLLTPEDVAQLGASDAASPGVAARSSRGAGRGSMRVRAARRMPPATGNDSNAAAKAPAVTEPANHNLATAPPVRLPQRRYVPAAAAARQVQPQAKAADADDLKAGGDDLLVHPFPAMATGAGGVITAVDAAAALASAQLPPMPPLPLQLWPLRLPPGERLFRLRPRAELLQRTTVRTAAAAAAAAAARRQASKDAAADAAAAAAAAAAIKRSDSSRRRPSKPTGAGAAAAAATAPTPSAAAVAPIYPPRHQQGSQAAAGDALLRRCLALLSRRLCVERTEVLTLESLVRAAWAMCVARLYTPRLFRYAAARLLGLRSTAPLEGRPALLRALVEVRAMVARQRPSTWRRLRLNSRWRQSREAGARWRLGAAELLAAQPAGMVRQLLRAQAALEAAAEARELPIMWRTTFAGDRHAVMQLGRRAAFAIVLVAPWHEAAAGGSGGGTGGAAAAAVASSSAGRTDAVRGAGAGGGAGDVKRAGPGAAGVSAAAAATRPAPAQVPAPLAAGSLPVRLLRLRGWLVAALRVEPWLALPPASREEQLAALYGRMLEAARQRGERLRAAAAAAATAVEAPVAGAKALQKAGFAKRQGGKTSRKL